VGTGGSGIGTLVKRHSNYRSVSSRDNEKRSGNNKRNSNGNLSSILRQKMTETGKRQEKDSRSNYNRRKRKRKVITLHKPNEQRGEGWTMRDQIHEQKKETKNYHGNTKQH